MKRFAMISASALLVSGVAFAQQTPNTATGSGSNNNLSTERTDPNTPKPYQPSNPGADTRKPPTSSTTGTGNSSGGRPEMSPKK